MRMLLSCLFVLGLSLNATAQITRSNWLIGGSATFSKDKSMPPDGTIQKVRIINITGNVGFFPLEKFAVGLLASSFFSSDKYKQIDGSSFHNTQHNLGAGPFVRYYFLNAENRMNIFTDEGIVYSYGTIRDNRQLQGHFKSYQYHLSAGAVVFLNSSVGVEFITGYYKFNEVGNDTKFSSLQCRFGFQFHLEKE